MANDQFPEDEVDACGTIVSIREAHPKSFGINDNYKAAVRLIERVGKSEETPRVAREWIAEWRRTNRLTPAETKKLLEQLNVAEDAEEEAQPEPTMRCPPPKALGNRPSASFITIAKLIKSRAVEADRLRKAICDSAKGGLLHKREQRRLFSMLDRAAARQKNNRTRSTQGKEELFVEGPMDGRAEPEKPQLFRRPVASERKARTNNPAQLRAGELPKPLGPAREGLVVVNTSAGIKVCRQR